MTSKKLFREGEDTGEGDADPGRAVVELVEEFIEGLFEQVRVEQAMGLRGLWSEMRIRGDGGAPGGEEFGGDGVLPELGPGFESFGGVGVALGEVVEGGIGGVAEGAEHAGEIAEGGLLGPTFRERAGGLAFEVEDDVVAAGAEELTEVVVAVDADALASLLGGDFGDGAGAGKELDAAGQDERGGVDGEGFGIGEGVEGVLQCVEGTAIWRRMRVASADRSSAEGFGGEGGVVCRRSEGEVHLRGTAAEQGGGVKGKAACSRASLGMDSWPGSSRKVGGDRCPWAADW